METQKKSTQSTWNIWRWPSILAAMTMAGLLSALLETGIWRILSWVLLIVPLWMVFKYSLRPKGKETK